MHSVAADHSIDVACFSVVDMDAGAAAPPQTKL